MLFKKPVRSNSHLKLESLSDIPYMPDKYWKWRWYWAFLSCGATHTHWRGQRAPAASLLPLLGVDRLLLEENQSLSAGPVLFHSFHILKWSTSSSARDAYPHQCKITPVTNYTYTHCCGCWLVIEQKITYIRNIVRPTNFLLNFYYHPFQIL